MNPFRPIALTLRGIKTAIAWVLKTIWRGIAGVFKGISSGIAGALGGLRTAIFWMFRKLKSPRVLVSTVAVAVGVGLGIIVAQVWLLDDSADAPATNSPGSTTPSGSDGPSVEPASIGADTPEATPEATPEPFVLVLEEEPPTYQKALEHAYRLSSDIVLPATCGELPLAYPNLLPNAPRYYRSGIHQGVDFMCYRLGHSAVAAMDGRVVAMVGDYVDPRPPDRNRLLGIAGELRATPPFTLLSLYGNYVVIDHGVMAGVGHVVTLYTHLEAVDSDIGVGQWVRAGERVGEIGNRGTSAAANGDFSLDAHLHWEIHVDNVYLSAGLSASETRQVYTTLFAGAGERDTEGHFG